MSFGGSLLLDLLTGDFSQRTGIVLATSGSENGSQEHLDSSGLPFFFFPFCVCTVEWHLLCRHVFSCSYFLALKSSEFKKTVCDSSGSCFFCEIFLPALKTCCCLPNSPYPPFTSDWPPKDCFETFDFLQGLGKALSFSIQVCLAYMSV